MRRRLHAAVSCLLLSVLVVSSFVPCAPIWASEPRSAEGTAIIEDTPAEGEQGSGLSDTEGNMPSGTGGQSGAAEQGSNGAQATPSVEDNEAEGNGSGTLTPGEDGQGGEGGEAPVQPEESEESEESEDPEAPEDAAHTMTPEEFYSEFRGTSWRFRDGEPVGASALAGSGVTWKEEGGAFVGSNGMRVEGAGAIGIDVSSHNGKIDWAKVKAAGIDFAVIRCGFGTGGEDAQFLANVKGCLENGIPFGVYLYAYAWDAETATAEAEHLLDLLDEAGLDPEDLALPVFYDLEQEGEESGKPCGIDATGKEHPVSNPSLASMGEAFAEVVAGAGYTPGFYANLNWWNSYLTDPGFDSHPRWVAQYNDECTYGGGYDYWQCMPNGSVSGVSGTVDVNFSYTDDPAENPDDPAEEPPATWGTPVLNEAQSGSSGYRVSWNQVPDASGYAVFRKPAGGSWARIATVTSTSYMDTSLKSGTYYYTVRAYRGNKNTALNNKYDQRYWTGYDKTGVVVKAMAAPKLASRVATTSEGLKVSWSKVSGASGYEVYRKTPGGSWVPIGTTSSTSFTDGTAADASATYTYTVRPFAGDADAALGRKYSAEVWGGYNATGVTGRFLDTPALSNVTSNSNGRRVSWGKVDGAAGYEVFRKAPGGSWALIATTTSCAYTDAAKLSSGKTYRYTVRAYRGSVSTAKANKYDARYWGHYDTEGAPAVYLAAPSMTGTQKTSSGLKSSWTKVAGASGYEVYRKSPGGSWTPIATTVWTNYTDTTARDMTTYYYTVRPYKGSASTAKSHKYDASYWGGYDSKGWTVYNGFQNPAGYYQVSCYSVSIKNQGKNQFGYRTPSQISPDASKLECINAMVTRAYDYLGTPYRWDYSCAPGVGVDCSGLVMQALYACGMNLSPMNPWEHYYLGMTGGSHSAYANYMWNSGKFQKLSFSKRQRGDIVSWNGHVAIYLGNNQIIEANGRDVHIASVYAYGTPRGVLRPFIE